MKNPVVLRGLVVAGLCLPIVGAQHAAPLRSTIRETALTPQDSAFHALNRLAYGPRPGDVQRVAAEGVMRWIDRQLSPEEIDNERLAERERQFQILRYDRGDLAAMYVDAQRERRARKLAAAADTMAHKSAADPIAQRGRRLAGDRKSTRLHS